MLNRTAILADDDRRSTVQRHLRAEAERDLARRRRLIARIRADAAEATALRDRVLAPWPYHPVILTPERHAGPSPLSEAPAR